MYLDFRLALLHSDSNLIMVVAVVVAAAVAAKTAYQAVVACLLNCHFLDLHPTSTALAELVCSVAALSYLT